MNFYDTFLLLIGIALVGCGKSVQLGKNDPNSVTGSDASTTSSSGGPTCGPDQILKWTFVQPDILKPQSLDILIIMDTSSSLNGKRAHLASVLPDFLSKLPPQIDFRLSVMLAHGGASPFAGRLYSARNSPLVLDSKVLAINTIQAFLTQTLESPVLDADEANGEALMYSLKESLKPDRLAEIRSNGFYREDAALSLIFITDENDICFPPEHNSYTQFPDFVPSNGNIEAVAFQKYCRSSSQSTSNTPELLYSQLRSFKQKASLTLAGIVHIDPALIPKGSGIEDSIGHGILELLAQAPSSVGIDIEKSSYSEGLATLGTAVSTELNLMNQFGLSGNSPIRQNSLQTKVDGKQVEFQYNALNRQVQIQKTDAGQSGSFIEVTACKQ